MPVTIFDEFRLSVSFCNTAYTGFEASTTLEQLRRLQESWVMERNWTQYHTPRNLVLALVGEVGELAELFQWRGEVACSLPGWTERRKSISHKTCQNTCHRHAGYLFRHFRTRASRRGTERRIPLLGEISRRMRR
jgi:hypothetical protein